MWAGLQSRALSRSVGVQSTGNGSSAERISHKTGKQHNRTQRASPQTSLETPPFVAERMQRQRARRAAIAHKHVQKRSSRFSQLIFAAMLTHNHAPPQDAVACRVATMEEVGAWLRKMTAARVGPSPECSRGLRCHAPLLRLRAFSPAVDCRRRAPIPHRLCSWQSMRIANASTLAIEANRAGRLNRR